MSDCHATCRCNRLLGPLVVVLVVMMFVMTFFSREPETQFSQESASQESALPREMPTFAGSSGETTHFQEARAKMIRDDLAARDIRDPRVLEAMGRVPRQRFVPERYADEAYGDRPLPIGHGQTISQPYIVALMTQLTEPKPTSRALDVGTGSGYQAAVLSELCKEVYSIEIVEPLATEAKKRLAELGYRNVTVRHGDGYRGWKEHSPFDVIIVAAAADHVPEPLVEQLAPGGRLVMPVGNYFQDLLLVEKRADGSVGHKKVAAVAFVPMTGEAER
ncbi:MAG TPA: protein-L-isoaspartate(D-aspartate) O-methyltransferase [Thermoguttaceae bacterium]|nr:protein-L-isoaspartate(D-aspartate) O-methyltransferase [Thermoguttaceae bacterium]